MQIGDVVRLKGGSPLMTVTHSSGDNVVFAWVENGYQQGNAHPDALVVQVDGGDPKLGRIADLVRNLKRALPERRYGAEEFRSLLGTIEEIIRGAY